ncbi:MAG: TonB-dependent receptor domain-containing protein [Steroidobacteraceae bacterium]
MHSLILRLPDAVLLWLIGASVVARVATAADVSTAYSTEESEIVVVGSAEPRPKLRASVDISTLDATRIEESSPLNPADVLRNVPGVLAAASGGEGNANVASRGLPVSGGAKFTQFQEDGLPVLDFGDIEFATADTFVKLDYNVARLQVVRGGTAATATSNGPGAVFNFISKTGDEAGGNFSITRGVNFDRTRLDFDYGEPLNEGWKFHIGGFYRSGEGLRDVGYTAESGGQLKGNVTRQFTNGYLRLSFKLLDDRAPVYLPVPISLTGSNTNPRYHSVPGFTVLSGAMQSRDFLHDLSVDQNGNRLTTDIADGYRSQSRVLGAQAAFELPEAWHLEERFRIAATSGGFVGPYPAEVDAAAALAGEIGGPGASLRYATGPLGGQELSDPGALGGNGLAVRTHLFNVTLNDVGNAANDVAVSRNFEDLPIGSVAVKAGYFKSRQNIVMDWHWNTYLEEVRGKNPALLDVIAANGTNLTQRGLVAYGEPLWGNCCVRSYQLHYDTDAPYLSLSWESGPLNVDGGVRYDIAKASGTYAAAEGTIPLDVNNDGLIEVPEQTVPVANSGNPQPVNYTVRYASYSVGINYLVTPELAVFARTSEGGRANATRLLFGGGIRPSGDIAADVAVNHVREHEAGTKWGSERLSLVATGFYVRTEVTDQDITLPSAPFARRIYGAWGLELEGAYRAGPFRVNSALTYTVGKIDRDEITPSEVGQRFLPYYLYQLTGAYSAARLGAGVNLIGISAVPNGSISLPAFIQTNAFVTYELTQGLQLGLRVNNLLNSVGFTESQTTSIPSNSLATARSITGRAIEVSLRYLR